MAPTQEHIAQLLGELWDTQAIDPWDLISLSALRLMVGGDTREEFKDILSDILVSWVKSLKEGVEGHDSAACKKETLLC